MKVFKLSACCIALAFLAIFSLHATWTGKSKQRSRPQEMAALKSRRLDHQLTRGLGLYLPADRKPGLRLSSIELEDVCSDIEQNCLDNCELNFNGDIEGKLACELGCTQDYQDCESGRGSL